MRIFINQANESWIVDRLRDEWIKFNELYFEKKTKKANIVWIIAPWTWSKLKKKNLNDKLVICTIHHIDFDKFQGIEKDNFFERDNFVDYYHAISKSTEKQLREITDKPIITMPFWGNQNIFYDIKDKEKLRKKYNLELDAYIVGSFQRDTEGFDLTTPKFSKGPDQFVEIVKDKYEQNKTLKVLLTGKRRNYIITKLKELGIPYYYFEMVNFEELNELYNLLDLYIVSSRVEGGPQAIVECGLSKTPIISTDVGLARDILHKESIYNFGEHELAKPNINEAYNNSTKYQIPEYFSEFNKIFQKQK